MKIPIFLVAILIAPALCFGEAIEIDDFAEALDADYDRIAGVTRTISVNGGANAVFAGGRINFETDLDTLTLDSIDLTYTANTGNFDLGANTQFSFGEFSTSFIPLNNVGYSWEVDSVSQGTLASSGKFFQNGSAAWTNSDGLTPFGDVSEVRIKIDFGNQIGAFGASNLTAVPEPSSTFAIAAFGLAGLGYARRRFKKRNADKEDA